MRKRWLMNASFMGTSDAYNSFAINLKCTWKDYIKYFEEK
jgi:hypothetical protein